jgi:hypothetical protein
MFMIRRLSLLVGLVFVVSLTAHAQGLGDKVELFGGYSYVHVSNEPSFSTNGFELSGEYKFLPWAGAVGDFNETYGFGNLHTALFGPQVSWPARVSPFAHVLIGVAHGDAPGGFEDNSFGVAIGGGIDTKLVPHVYWRIFEGDYMHTHLFGVGEDNARLSTGIVIHL